MEAWTDEFITLNTASVAVESAHESDRKPLMSVVSKDYWSMRLETEFGETVYTQDVKEYRVVPCGLPTQSADETWPGAILVAEMKDDCIGSRRHSGKVIDLTKGCHVQEWAENALSFIVHCQERRFFEISLQKRRELPNRHDIVTYEQYMAATLLDLENARKWALGRKENLKERRSSDECITLDAAADAAANVKGSAPSVAHCP